MTKKKVSTTETTEEAVAVEEQIPKSQEDIDANSVPNETPIEKLIAEAPEMADVMKNPWLYSEWLNKLRGLPK